MPVNGFVKEACGCWVNVKKGLIIPVCEPHFQKQLAYARHEGPSLTVGEVCGTVVKEAD